MISAFQSFVRSTDAAIGRVYLSRFRERRALMGFMFHSMFRDEADLAANVVDPLQRTTVEQFREFVAYYLENGYRFVSPEEVVNGLDPDHRYGMITFDDGYYNNTLALPVLEEFQVPATFFISTNHVLQNKCFWWDVLYRERTAQGASHEQIKAEGLEMKSLRNEQVEKILLERFGPDALRPRGRIDRPFTPEELRQFAISPYVHIGNHTADHAILINYPRDEMRQQLREAQDVLRSITGKTPISIAYPNGGHDEEVVKACGEVGLKLGVTIRPEKNPLPLDPASPKLARLGRFCPHGEARMVGQCQTFRSDFQLYGLLRDTYLRFARGKVHQ